MRMCQGTDGAVSRNFHCWTGTRTDPYSIPGSLDVYVLRSVLNDEALLHELLHFCLSHSSRNRILDSEAVVRLYVGVIMTSSAYKEFLRGE